MKMRIVTVGLAGAFLILNSPVLAIERLVPSQYSTIQAGIDDCSNGDVVIVEPNIYTGPGNRDIDFKGLAITVRSTDPNDPNVVAATVIDCNGSFLEPHRGFHFHSGEGSSSILDGLTIMNGFAPDAWTTSCGGGILCSGASPTIRNCYIANNTASAGLNGRGGGIYCSQASPTISNCTISGNYASHFGGGVHGSRGPITSCTINNNSVVDKGGGLWDCDGPITNCTITGNWVEYQYGSGGGLQACGGSIRNCTISHNSAGYGGGLSGCSRSIRNCTISDNRAGKSGGGLRGCDGDISNCTISGNWAGDSGGGLYNCGGQWYRGVIGNCTISGNSANWGGGMYDCESSVSNSMITGNSGRYGGGLALFWGSVTNCTFRGNLADQGGAMYRFQGPSNKNCIFVNNTGHAIYSYSFGLTHCLFYANPNGDLYEMRTGRSLTGAAAINSMPSAHDNIDGDPLFVTGPLGDYYLSQMAAGQAFDSPCVDAGSDTAANLGMDIFTTRTDHIGDEGVVDMGYHYSIANPADINRDWGVDAVDFVILASQWQQEPGIPSADIAPPGGDGFVNIKDLALLVDNWLWEKQ